MRLLFCFQWIYVNSVLTIHILDIDTCMAAVHQEKCGFPQAVVLHSRTPHDVCEYLKDFHNRWHSGAGATVLELVTSSLDIDKAWLAHASLGWAQTEFNVYRYLRNFE